MNFTIETFLAQSRSYLLEADVQMQQGLESDLVARAYATRPVPRRRGERRARAAKARPTARTTGVG